jgi:uncharacterized membrane protein (UPF0182 family)
VVIGFAADLAWFGSLGYDAVLWTRVIASFGLFAGVTLLTWLFIAVNVLIARRLDPYGLVNTPPEQIAAAFGVRVPVVILVAAAAFAVFTGLSYASDWQQLLLYLNQTPFGETDPLFGEDVAFYMFTLPIWELLRGWLFTVSMVSIAAVAVTAGAGWRGWNIKPAVLRHLAILGALALATIAWEYRLQAYELLFSPTGVVYGAGYADVQARLPVYNILIFVTLAAAVLLIVTGFLRRGWRAIGVVLAVWVAVTVVASSIYPALVQRFVVAPNELTLEQPYIANNITMTRSAFNLDEIDKRSYIASGQVTPAALLAEPETIRNVRLWDYRPLLQTYNQIQGAAPVLRVHRRRCGPLHHRRAHPAGDGGRARVEPGAAQRGGADVGQPETGLHPRLRRGNVAGRADHARRVAGILPQGSAGAGRDRCPVRSRRSISASRAATT